MRIFFNLRARKFRFPKYKKNFSREKIINFLKSGFFFYFLNLGLKLHQGALYVSTFVNIIKEAEEKNFM